MSKILITIDGPAGTGKTTVAKGVAEKLNLPYFDTGAMYRAVTDLLLREKIPLSDEEKIRQVLLTFDFQIRIVGNERRYFVGGSDVTEAIRSQVVTNTVSAVAALPIVRKALWEIQRRFARRQGGVFEGRDMGSVVFPKAKYKIFLTARPEVRASRRLTELQEKRPSEAALLNHQQMLGEMMQRDQLDSSRQLAPLLCPPDAYVIDASDISIHEVVERILEYTHKKNLISAWLHKKKMPWIYRFVIFVAWVIGKVFYRLKVYGLEHYYPRGAILAANHTSFFDPPILAATWPEEVHFLARETLFENFLFGALIRNVNAHPISRGTADLGAIKTICGLLEEGKKVVLFPEGTRSPDGELQSLKPGIASLILRTSTAVIPCYIHGAYEAWGRKQKWPRPFGKVCAIFGSPILAATFAHLDKKEAQRQISEQLEAAMLRLKQWFEEGGKGVPP
jgi:cytidylate kinase